MCVTDGYFQTNTFEISRAKVVPNLARPLAPTTPTSVEDAAPRPGSSESPAARPPSPLLKAPPTERIIRIPSPYVDPDSVAAVEDSLKSSAQNPGYQLKSRYDNTFLFRMLTEYQTKGWEVMEMEFSVGGDPSSDSQILFVVLRRERQSVKNP